MRTDRIVSIIGGNNTTFRINRLLFNAADIKNVSPFLKGRGVNIDSFEHGNYMFLYDFDKFNKLFKQARKYL